jgi:uncharacterized protein (TIGR02996 family)
MSDEDAFLAAIRAAPGDDAPRLVYADWLEELGRFAEAEFIRVERQNRLLTIRFGDLLQSIDNAWLAKVYPKYELILKEYPANRRVDVVVIIRQLAGYGLAEARDLVQRLPSSFGSELKVVELLEMRACLAKVGAIAELRLA